MKNATLIGDKGYISKTVQTRFVSSMQYSFANALQEQSAQTNWHPVFRKSRKRIETLFSQLCDQMMMRRNHAKSLNGLTTRLITKIAAATLLQAINYQQQKPINPLKHALAA